MFQIAEQAFRGSRIGMDIEAGAPIILVPHSSRTTDILVLDMGTLTVNNSFMLAGDENTISAKKGFTTAGSTKVSSTAQSPDTNMTASVLASGLPVGSGTGEKNSM